MEDGGPVTFMSASTVWEIGTHAPTLLHALAQQDEWAFDHARALPERIPVAITSGPFDAGGYFRPIRHIRAFYIRGPHGVVAIKGSEIHTDDQMQLLAAGKCFRTPSLWATAARRTSMLSLLERFPILEHKVPGALLLSEAIDEAMTAAELQVAHLQRYGELAQVPLPLAVVRWPDVDVERFAARILAMLSPRAGDIVRRWIDGGLACHVYYYPGPTRRVNQLLTECPEIGRQYSYRERRAALAHELDPERAVTGWLSLAGRMLALGYFPNSPYNNYFMGQCLQQQNAVVDGGFVDLDSVLPMRAVATDREFHETFLAMIAELVATLRVLLIGNLPVPNLEFDDPTLPSLWLTVCVWDELKRRLHAELASGGLTDPRLAPLITSTGIMTDLDRGLSLLYPSAAITPHPVLRHFFGLREASL